MRIISFLSALSMLVLHVPTAVSDEREEVIGLVVSSIEENNRCFGNVKADLVQRIVSHFTRSQSDVQPNSKTKGTLRLRNGEPGTPPPIVIKWTAILGDTSERYEILAPHGQEVISVDSTGLTRYQPDRKQAVIMNWSPERLASQQQYDPREIGFLSMAERLTDILKVGQVDRATIDTRPSGAVATIQFHSVVHQRPVIVECSSKVNFLPTRVTYMLNGFVDATSELVYETVETSCGPRWFLKSAVRRHAVTFRNEQVTDKNWGQTITTVVSNLDVGAAAPPPRASAETLPKGTVIKDTTQMHSLAQGVPSVTEELRWWLVVLTVVAVIVLCAILVWRKFQIHLL